jgi:hypothetical protein
MVLRQRPVDERSGIPISHWASVVYLEIATTPSDAPKDLIIA